MPETGRTGEIGSVDEGGTGCSAEGAPRAAWYVLQTKQHCEEQVAFHLRRKQLDCYLPRTRQWPRPAVGADVAALFPGYLFVKLDLATQFSAALWSPGVRRFVSFEEGAPADVPAEAIQFLKEREDEDGLVHCGDSGPACGRNVRVARGAFKDLCGVVERRLPAKDRVVLLMSFLQRDVRVELPEHWVSRP